MAMSERIARLRQESLDAKPTLSPERAALMTAFYQKDDRLASVPVQRARSFLPCMPPRLLPWWIAITLQLRT